MIQKIKFESEMVDLMDGCERWSVDVDGGHGVVALVDVMPRFVSASRMVGESAIVQAARTSTGQGLKSEAEDKNLIRYLYRNRHTTPLEMVELKWHHVLPIFVARQLIRHRTANVNEYSLRYSEVKDRFWFPTGLREQWQGNKQGGDVALTGAEAQHFLNLLETDSRNAMATYKKGLEAGISRELARVGLGVNLYTEWYWKIDLHNLIHFLGLRQDKHAQVEIRAYADAMYEICKGILPWAMEAYDDYHPNRGGMLLSRAEIMSLEANELKIELMSGREIKEFGEKCKRLGRYTMAQECEKRGK